MRVGGFVSTWLFVALAAAPSFAASDAPSEEEMIRAQQAFEDGERLFKRGRYEAAIEEYKASFEYVETANAAYMIGRSLAKLKRYPQAYRALRRAVRVAGHESHYADTKKAAQDEIDKVRSKVALAIIEIENRPEELEVTAGGEKLDTATLFEAKAFEPGKTRFVAKSGGKVVSRTVELEAGKTEIVELRFDPRDAGPDPLVDEPEPTEDEGSGIPLRTWSYVAAGVGVAGFATFGVFGAMSRSTYADLESRCPNFQCRENEQDAVDSGQREQLIANVGLVVGAVGIGTGAVLFFLGGDDGESSGDAATFTHVGIGPGYVSARGRF